VPEWLNLAIALITQFEGWSSDPYQDPVGTWTIGYGFTGPDIGPKTAPMTKEAAISRLNALLGALNARLDVECKEPLTDHQRAACLSLAYNIGMGAFSRSNLLKYLNDGAYGAAASQFSLFTWSKGLQLPGLVKRREAEIACFNTPDQV
jgi:lysozyme